MARACLSLRRDARRAGRAPLQTRDHQRGRGGGLATARAGVRLHRDRDARPGRAPTLGALRLAVRLRIVAHRAGPPDSRCAPARPRPGCGARRRRTRFAGGGAGDRVSGGGGDRLHRDAPQFGVVVGISLLGACRMRFRRGAGAARQTRAVVLEPHSAYAFVGEARWQWQHSIPAMKTPRYSITFRTLREGAAPRPGARPSPG
jgi:hypothetical protein